MANALNLGDVVLPGDGFPDFYSFSIPVWDNMAGAFLFKGGLNVNNLAPDRDPATLVGTPTSGAGFASLGKANYIQTDLTDSAEMTFIIGCRPKVGPVAYISNYLTAANGGQILSSNGSSLTSVAASSGRGTGVDGQALLTGITPGAWGCYAIRSPANGQTEAMNLLTGVSALSPGSAPRVMSAEKVRIGSTVVGFDTGTCDVSFALIYNRRLTDPEMTSLGQWSRGYMVDSGLIPA